MGLFDKEKSEEVKLAKKEYKRLTAIANPFDVEAVKQQFDKYLETIDTMIEAANEHRINDQPTMEFAVGMAGEAKKLSKTLEAKRTEIVKAPNGFVKSVNAFVKSFAKPLAEIETILKRKITSYTLTQELERRAKEKKAKEEAAALQAAIDKEAKEKGIESITLAPVVEPEIDKVTRSGSGASVGMAKVWKATVIDPSSVPREFCKPDNMKITEAVHAGLRELPGVEIWEDTQVRLRT